MFMCLCVTKVLSGVDQTNQGFTSCKIGLFLVKEGVFLSIKKMRMQALDVHWRKKHDLKENVHVIIPYSIVKL